MTVVSFRMAGDRAAVTFPYDPAVVDVLKANVPPHARAWEPDGKTWWVDTAWVMSLAAVLTASGSQVSGLDAQPTKRGTSWAQELLSRLPGDRRAEVYRSLSRHLHPDVGGDPNLQGELNDAYSRLAGRGKGPHA